MPETGFTSHVHVEATAAATHPADLTPEQRAHLGLPPEPEETSHDRR